jgi:Subtilase family
MLAAKELALSTTPILLLTAALVVMPPAVIAQATPSAPPSSARKVITRADDLPRREYALPKLPSALVEGQAAELVPLADRLDSDIVSDLTAFDIQDASTLRGMLTTRLQIAMLKGEWSKVPGFAAEVRGLQDKPAGRLTAGVLSEIVSEVSAKGGDPAAQRASAQSLTTQRFGAMPWNDVQDALKGLKGQLELANPNLVVGGVRAQMDPAAQNAGMKVTFATLGALIAARVTKDRVMPVAPAIVAGLTPIIDRNTVAKPDRWSERLVALSPRERLTPVTIGIWDTGVDMALFKSNGARGMAFDDAGHPVPNQLRDLGEAKGRWPELKAMTKGALDLRAALDTPEARELKGRVAELKPEDAKAFQEDLALAGLYTHGTHVAGIAVAGNPYAGVYPVAMHWAHSVTPPLPTEERALRTAANYRTIVEGFREAGVRVVNMSWRYGPTFYEGALAFHGIGKDPIERKALAMKLFAIERDALKAAFESAPEILFVAGSGNEDNSADFVEYIPAGFELPNLITAGAVDQSGEGTSFSTFGRTVVVHANGFEVDSFVPGGDRLKLSGTSMAAPQVTNLAAKLFALNPELTAGQAKAMILGSAERNGRVNLINPRAALAKARAGA